MKSKSQRGIVQLVIILLIAILSLSYFGIDLEQAVTKPLFKKNLIFTWNTAKSVWVNYIYDPVKGIFIKGNGTDTVNGGGTIVQ